MTARMPAYSPVKRRGWKLTEHSPLSQIVSALSPKPGELVVRKQQASAFFGTGFAAWLTGRGADTLVVAGCTTSGCVRATVVDSVAHNLRTIVPTDCVGDRALAPHQANLFDMARNRGPHDSARADSGLQSAVTVGSFARVTAIPQSG